MENFTQGTVNDGTLVGVSILQHWKAIFYIFKQSLIALKHGQMVWNGTVRVNEINGTYTWIKKKGKLTKMREYWFEGSLK